MLLGSHLCDWEAGTDNGRRDAPRDIGRAYITYMTSEQTPSLFLSVIILGFSPCVDFHSIGSGGGASTGLAGSDDHGGQSQLSHVKLDGKSSSRPSKAKCPFFPATGKGDGEDFIRAAGCISDSAGPDLDGGDTRATCCRLCLH